MNLDLRAAANRLLGRPRAAASSLNPHKKELIDFAYARLGMRSFADLGAVWNVAGGYSFYAMEQHGITQAALVDTDITPAVRERQIQHPGLRIIQGNFGDASIAREIGSVDAVFLFDTLLHQVNPNWDQILKMYSSVAKIWIIFNQQYTDRFTTTRLLDLGRDEYFRNVPHTPDEELYRTCFQDLDAIDPKHGRPYRDIHSIWQWAMVDADLIACANDLGFRLRFYKNCGQFGQLANVENHAFVFSTSIPAAP